MKLKILMFGMAQDAAGGSSVEIDLSAETLTVGQLKTALVDRYPELAKLVSFLIAVNAEYAYDESKIIRLGDEIAVIPPTSGG